MAAQSEWRSVQFTSCFVVVVACASLAIYGAPMMLAVFDGNAWGAITDRGTDSWVIPLARSVVFATVSAGFAVLLGFGLAVCMLGHDGSSRGHWTALLLVPLLVGNTTVAFVVKILLMDSDAVTTLIANRSGIATWGLMLGIQLWQYTPACAYMFFVRLRWPDRRREEFAHVAGLTGGERLRDVRWPSCRNLAGLLALFAFGEGLYEHTKSAIVLRASAGTATELISHRLQRYYEAWRLSDPVAATKMTMAVSAMTTIAAVLLALLFAWALCRGGDLAVRGVARIRIPTAAPAFLSQSARVVLVVLVVSPFLYLLTYLRIGGLVAPTAVGRSAGLSALALALAATAVVAFACSARILWPRALQKFDARSLPFFGGLYVLHLVPAVAVAFCAYYWIAAADIGSRTNGAVVLLWLTAQVIIAFPLLGSFVQLANCRVRHEELAYQRATGATWTETLSTSFLRRLRGEYVLIGLFGFAVIWNESVLNATMSTLSDSIASLAVEISQRVSGRSGAYAEAAWFILFGMTPTVCWTVLWIAYMRRAENMEISAR